MYATTQNIYTGLVRYSYLILRYQEKWQVKKKVVIVRMFCTPDRPQIFGVTNARR
jgi:hypothetical protein